MTIFWPYSSIQKSNRGRVMCQLDIFSKLFPGLQHVSNPHISVGFQLLASMIKNMISQFSSILWQTFELVWDLIWHENLSIPPPSSDWWTKLCRFLVSKKSTKRHKSLQKKNIEIVYKWLSSFLWFLLFTQPHYETYSFSRTSLTPPHIPHYWIGNWLISHYWMTFCPNYFCFCLTFP